jgi:hypothetical protein
MKWPGRPATRRATSGASSRWTKTWVGADSRRMVRYQCRSADQLTTAPVSACSASQRLIVCSQGRGDREAQLRSLSELRAGFEPAAARFAAGDAQGAHDAMTNIISEAVSAVLQKG